MGIVRKSATARARGLPLAVWLVGLMLLSLAAGRAEAVLVDNGDGTVTDTRTGLMWQQADDHNDTAVDWQEALAYCESLTVGGHEDWRLPNVRELESLVDLGEEDPSIDSFNFPECRSSRYWTSSTNLGDFDGAWVVEFLYGGVGTYDKESTNAVRCVRAGPGSHVPPSPNLVDHGDGTVTDTRTGLMWQQADDQNNAPHSWQEALAYCESLTVGGHEDWRLPNVRELESLVDAGKEDPSIDFFYFPECRTSRYWTSSTNLGDYDGAWVVEFLYGGVGTYDKENTNYVRCVRAGAGSYVPPSPNLVDHGDGTVTDTRTGLMWQQGDEQNDSSRTWESALSYCEDLVLGGHKDWRLPNVRELESLVDAGKEDPSIDFFYFPECRTSRYWTSSTNLGDYDGAWVVEFLYGGVGTYDKENTNYVRCVRAGPGFEPDLTIAQLPMSGPPGTTFTQWGTGFTPNRTATLHFKKPDGTEYPSQSQPLDDIGHFEITYTAPLDKPPGTYTWWAIDDATGRKSNEVSYEITSESLRATVSGRVSDSRTGEAVSGAEVILGSNTTATDGNGYYRFDEVLEGSYDLRVSKNGYYDRSTMVAVNAGAWKSVDVSLDPVESLGKIKITGHSQFYDGFPTDSIYEGTVHYLAGHSHRVEHRVSIDWGGHPPGTVYFRDNLGDHPVAGAANVSKILDMGSDIEKCDHLTIVAASSDGTVSDSYVAKLEVMPDPFEWLSWSALRADTQTGFIYNSQVGVNRQFISEGVEAGVIPESIPLFGNHPFHLDFVPEIGMEVDSEGKSKLEFKWEDPEVGTILKREWGRKHDAAKMYKLLVDYIEKGRVDKRRLPKAAMANFEIVLYPYIDFDGRFVPGSCAWDWDGYFGLAGKVELKRSWPFVLMAGPVPIPMYAKAGLKLDAGARIGLLNLDPFAWNGKIDLDPYVRGSLGAGIDSVFAVEGWIGGGAEFGLQYPEEPTLEQLQLYLNAGVSAYALLFKWESNGLRWDWDLLQGVNIPTVQTGPNQFLLAPQLAERNYLHRPGYARFLGGRKVLWHRGTFGGRPYTTGTALLQENVFKHSEAALGISGDHTYAAWLFDDPNRSAVNRTMLVFSGLSNGAWSVPEAVADDGTADFHPRLLVYPDGSALLVWVNVSQVMPDTAVFEDMVSHLEINASHYDPVSGSWGPAAAVTQNDHLDRTPLISGSADDTMVVWVENVDNDIRGGSEHPNRLWYSLWNGSEWSAPVQWAEVPYGIVKMALDYHGGMASLVLSVDSDNDSETVNDHELMMAVYESGEWSVPAFVTHDDVADDNPALLEAASGDLWLLWLKAGEVSAVIDGDMDNRQVVLDSEYSSNLADFKAVCSTDGKIAVLWAEPSDYSSDIFGVFYDPAYQVWGQPKQLSFDEATEMGLAAAFQGDTLLAVYDQVPIQIETIERETLSGDVRRLAVPVQGLANLAVLVHSVSSDPALSPDSLITSPLNPEPEREATLRVEVINQGDTAFSDMPVTFYLGDPADGGEAIGTAVLSETLSPGDAAEVSLNWTVPYTDEPIGIYAVVDAEKSHEDGNRANNQVTNRFVEPDLTVDSLFGVAVDSDRFVISATVKNVGSIACAGTKLTLHQDAVDGPVIAESDVEALKAGLSQTLSLDWDASGIAGGEHTLYAVVDEADAVAEFDEGNNTRTMTLEVRLAGDMNGDGEITPQDALCVLQKYVGICPTSCGECSDIDGDVNGDGQESPADALCILQSFVGLPSCLD